MINEGKNEPVNILALTEAIESFKEEQTPLTEHEREILDAVFLSLFIP